MQRSGNLRRDHGLALERRPWLVEQLGWTMLIVLGLGALAASVALTGPLAHARARAGALEVEYSAVARQNAPTALVFHLRPGGEGEVRLVLGADYLRAVVLARVSPAPDRVEARPGSYVYVFRRPDPSAPATLVFDVRPQQVGQQVVRAGLDGGEMLAAGQLVLP